MNRHRYRCPNCRKPVVADVRLRGKKVNCPECYLDHVVPMAAAAEESLSLRDELEYHTPAAANLVDKSDRVRVACAHCGRDLAIRSSSLNRKITCPKCGEAFVAALADGKTTPPSSTTAASPAQSSSRLPTATGVDPHERAEQQAEAARRQAALEQQQREAEEARRTVEAARQMAEAEERRQREAAERARREEQERQRSEEALRLQAEADRRQQEELDRQQAAAAIEHERHAELQRQRDEEAQRLAEVERQRREEAARRDAELEAQRQAELQQRREAEALRQAEEVERRRVEAAAEAVLQAELQRERDEEARRLAEIERQRQEEEARQQAEEAARKKVEAEAEAKRQAELKRQRDEAERLRRAEEARLKAVEAARLKAEAAARKKAEAEAEAQRQAELKRQREEEARQKAEAERVRREEEARLKAEAAARKQAEQEAELQRQREEEARRKAEAEERRRLDAEAQERERARLAALRERLADREVLPPADSAEFQERFADQLVLRRKSFDHWQAASTVERINARRDLEDVERRRWQMEQLLFGGESPNAAANADAPRRHRLGEPLATFLCEAVEVRLGGVSVPTAIGVLNPFRIAQQPATAPSATVTDLVRRIQGNTAAPKGMRVGLERFIAAKWISQAADPASVGIARERLVAELFWFHLSTDEFSLMRDIGDVSSALAIKYLGNLCESTANDSALCLPHSRAVAWLSAAIAREAAFASGFTSNGLGYWDVALDLWSELLSADAWWEYFARRAKSNRADPQLPSQIRRQLPLFLAALVTRFARAYGQRGDALSCHRLVGVLRRSALPAEVQDGAAIAAVRASFY